MCRSRRQRVQHRRRPRHRGPPQRHPRVVAGRRRSPGDSRMTDFLKAEQLSNAKWRVLAIPFGGPFKGGKDSDDEYFSLRTDIKASWFKERPVLFHHGQDEVLKDADLGTEDDLELEDDGWWGKLWLDRSNRYFAQVNKLLAAGKMYGSSGALGHLVQKARDGERSEEHTSELQSQFHLVC